ncbi:MAG: NDP-hexose 2,3-dehydratase family protein [Pseudomonadota bacterium]
MKIDILNKAKSAVREDFSIERISLKDQSDWTITQGALKHRSGGFFYVVGMRRGTPAIERLMLYQPQSAFNGLVSRCSSGSHRQFLVQARAEPGNVGAVQYGPTVQSTPANYMRLHGGAATSHIDMFLGFDDDIRVIDETTQLDLGERYFAKTKRVVLAEDLSDRPAQLPFVWVSSDAVAAAAGESYLLNTDLRSAFALSTWSATTDTAELTPSDEAVRRSLAAPPRADVFSQVFTRIEKAPQAPAEFVPLADLANWEIRDDGLTEKHPEQGISVGFFDVTANLREKSSWQQPLIECANSGEVVLACRVVQGSVEVFVQVGHEYGILGHGPLLPSWLRYPGEAKTPPGWVQRAGVLLETNESDEGGRFYKNASSYSLVEVESHADLDEETGVWVTVSELKRLLAVSSLCAIQLRVIASHLLALRC